MEKRSATIQYCLPSLKVAGAFLHLLNCIMLWISNQCTSIRNLAFFKTSKVHTAGVQYKNSLKAQVFWKDRGKFEIFRECFHILVTGITFTCILDAWLWEITRNFMLDHGYSQENEIIHCLAYLALHVLSSEPASGIRTCLDQMRKSSICSLIRILKYVAGVLVLQTYQPEYIAPAPQPEDTTIGISKAWTISPIPLDLHDPQLLATAAAESHFMEAEYDEYAARNASGAAFCRSAALMLMALPSLRHALNISNVDGDDGASTFFSRPLSRAAGLLLPCYMMAQAISILQCQRRLREAVLDLSKFKSAGPPTRELYVPTKYRSSWLVQVMVDEDCDLLSGQRLLGDPWSLVEAMAGRVWPVRPVTILLAKVRAASYALLLEIGPQMDTPYMLYHTNWEDSYIISWEAEPGRLLMGNLSGVSFCNIWSQNPFVTLPPLPEKFQVQSRWAGIANSEAKVSLLGIALDRDDDTVKFIILFFSACFYYGWYWEVFSFSHSRLSIRGPILLEDVLFWVTSENSIEARVGTGNRYILTRVYPLFFKKKGIIVSLLSHEGYIYVFWVSRPLDSSNAVMSRFTLNDFIENDIEHGVAVPAGFTFYFVGNGKGVSRPTIPGHLPDRVYLFCNGVHVSRFWCSGEGYTHEESWRYCPDSPCRCDFSVLFLH